MRFPRARLVLSVGGLFADQEKRVYDAVHLPLHSVQGEYDMNTTRLALAATFVDGIYGFAVYGNALAGQFLAFPGVFRSSESPTAYLPAMFTGILIAMFAVAYIYAKGYEGGSGIVEGLRFGLVIAVFNAGYFIATNYAILNIGSGLAVSMALAGLGEWLLVGGTIGVIYAPAGAGSSARRNAGV